MAEQSYAEEALFEHRFWLQILGDHSRFILTSLAATEAKEVEKAKAFVTTFDTLLEKARRGPTGTELTALNRDALQAAREIREFKIHLLKRHLTGQFALALSPSLLQHIIKEVDEYLRILEDLNAGKKPALLEPLEYHEMWLGASADHAVALSVRLDQTEKDLINKTELFEKDFSDLHSKAEHFEHFSEDAGKEFPAIKRLNTQAVLYTDLFRRFLQELTDLDKDVLVLDVFPPLLPDHMSREECYYLVKLARVAGTEAPKCDPGRPRVEG